MADAPDPRTLKKGRKTVNLLRVAQCQRGLVLCVAALVFIQLFNVFVGQSLGARYGMWAIFPGMLAYLAASITAIVFTTRLALAMGSHPALAALGAVLMLMPCANILLLLGVNGRATSLLKKHGIKIGLLGPPPTEYPKLYQNACPECGYDLSGNLTGVCPECGTEMAATG